MMPEETKTKLYDLVRSWLEQWGMTGLSLDWLSWVVLAVGVALAAGVANFVARRVFLTILSIIIKRTRTTWDDALLEHRVLHRAAHVAPALVFYWTAAAFPAIQIIIQRLAIIYILVVAGLVFSAFLNAVADVYTTLDVSRNRPIKGFLQVIKIVGGVFLAVVAIAAAFNQSPLGLLGGLGALTAVLILVFKDTILGLVASFQISTTDVVRIGDWIEVPQFTADGEVIDVSLHTVKVRNWDKSVSMIPTYALVSGTFRNWRGMLESDGRRIKRAVTIDMNTIKFCDEQMLQKYSRYQYIADYIKRKNEELARYNKDHNIDVSELINGRRLTNIGTFRAYLYAYLRNHPGIHQGLTLMVRQLPPSEYGLPIEIYVFAADKEWINYEGLQADIFDHILAIIPLFDLGVYQRPSGRDIRQASTPGAVQ
jgi:miniconductance mechanosensitive channel